MADGEADWQATLAEAKGAVDAEMQAGNIAGAVAAAMDYAPLHSKDEDVKAQHAQLVYKAMGAVPDAKISTVAKTLSTPQCDMAMKYVYRAMAETHECSSMLKWHAALLKQGGLGSISRVVASRKTV